MMLYTCLFVSLSVAKTPTQKRDFLKKTKQFSAVVSIDKLPHELYKELISEYLKFKMVDVRA